MPILVHDIAKEIPSNMQSMVKQAYFAWLVGATDLLSSYCPRGVLRCLYMCAGLARVMIWFRRAQVVPQYSTSILLQLDPSNDLRTVLSRRRWWCA
jgi:hypothetical protein